MPHQVFRWGGRGESYSAEGRAHQNEERDYDKEERGGEGSGSGAHRLFAPAGGDGICIQCVIIQLTNNKGHSS